MYLVEKQNNPFQIRKNNRIFVVDSKKLTIMAKEGLTPMMKQFYDLKAKHPDVGISMKLIVRMLSLLLKYWVLP